MTSRVPVAVIVITRNEERNIVDCLESVAWAGERVVVDSGSTDRTVDLATPLADSVYVTEWLGFAEAKNYALERVSSEWVLWLDADERVTSMLAEEIKNIVMNQSDLAGYEVARRAYFLGRWIKHCGWYPGYVVRLFKRSGAKFILTRVHERLSFPGAAGRLQGDLIHLTDENLFHYFEKLNRYTTLGAADMADSGRSASVIDLIVKPPFMFFKMYILRRGFLDGIHGLLLSMLSAAYVFVKYAKVRELARQRISATMH